LFFFYFLFYSLAFKTSKAWLAFKETRKKNGRKRRAAYLPFKERRASYLSIEGSLVLLSFTEVDFLSKKGWGWLAFKESTPLLAFKECKLCYAFKECNLSSTFKESKPSHTKRLLLSITFFIFFYFFKTSGLFKKKVKLKTSWLASKKAFLSLLF